MQAVIEQGVQQEGQPHFPSTQEEKEKVQMIFSTIHYAGLRGCDLSTLVPRLLECWTRVVDGRMVATF